MPQEPILEPGEPIHVVPATAPVDPVAAYEPTRVIPQVPVRAAVAPMAQPVVGVPVGPTYVDDRRRAWPYLIAVLALLLGGLVGFLIGNSRNDETSLTSSTQPIDSTVTSDATVEDLQNQVDLLTAAQTKAAQDLADAQATLAETEAERDALAAQAGTAGGTTSALQAELDASKAQVVKLQGDLDAATASLTQTQADLKATQGQLDAANATLADLHPLPLGNYVNDPVDKASSDAVANGWTLVTETVTTGTDAPGTVLDQLPAPNAKMVAGSVLWVQVKQ